MPETKTVGLKWRTRSTGERRAYWVARKDMIARGYRPKTVAIHFDPRDPDHLVMIAARCKVLQAEMLQWAVTNQPERSFDGTLRSLVERYETDGASPYRRLKPATARSYSKVLANLVKTVGARRVDAITGADVWRWYQTLCDQSSVGWAYYTVSVLKAVVSFGTSLGHQLTTPNPCGALREQMSAAQFRQPKARRSRLTYEQVVAFRAAANARGRPSAALWLTLQYELGMRRRDVIGEWIEDREGSSDGIRCGRYLWRDGLTWSHIDQNGILRKMISKTEHTTAREAVHRIADYPDLVAELERIPTDRRVGPLVVSETTGLPYTPEQCRRYFRLIARDAGIPDAVWNMDARAGAVTEAYESGATTEGAMAMAAHTQASTSRRYNRNTLEQTSRVAKLRVESRKKPNSR
jgi:hypothetical protein